MFVHLFSFNSPEKSKGYSKRIVMILDFIVFTLVIYLVYKVVFGFIVPVSKATRQVRRQFSDIQQHMQDQMNANQNGFSGNNASNRPSTPPPNQPNNTKLGDYIDFEDVK